MEPISCRQSSMMRRTMIISDVHLLRGSDSCVAMLSPIFDACDHLIVNGDLVEYHKEFVKDQAQQVVEEMTRIADKKNTKLSLLAGNHDHDISNERAITFAEGRIVVTHGDAFHTMIAPWARHAKIIREAWETTRQAQSETDEEETIENRFDTTRLASIAEWTAEEKTGVHTDWKSMLSRPRIVWRILRYWKESPELARCFMARFYPEATHAITGHSHRQNIDRRRSPTVINTGSFTFPGRPRCVILDGDEIQVIRLVKEGRCWMPDAKRKPLLHDWVKGASIESGRQGISTEI